MGFYQTILQQYGADSVQLLKKWAKLNNKMASLKNRKLFLITCRSQGIVPTHIRNNTKHLPLMIETTNGRTARETLDFMSRLDRKILNLEINITFKSIKQAERSLKDINQTLSKKIPNNILTQFEQFQNRSYENTFKKIKKNNIKKVTNLKNSELENILQIQDNWIRDLSGCDIPSDIKKLLALGHKFSIEPNSKDIDLKKMLADIENIINLYPASNRNVLRAKVTNALTNFVNKPANNNYLRNLLFKTKKFFKAHPELLVTKADKGNVTVIIKKEEYVTKSLEILEDVNYYKTLSRDPTSTYQQKANKIVSNLKNSNILSPEQARQLTIYNQASPKFYGLPKIHKQNVPLRPIISSINAPNSKLAQFATDILTQAYDDNNIYFTRDSFTFSDFINNKQLPPDYVIISLDVISLFSNIPYYLIKNSIIKHWQQISEKTNLSQKKFLEIVEFIFDTTYCKFEGKYYKQILGTPMGATISPIASQYVMDDLLNDCIPRLDFQLPFIKKYVDDIITAVPGTKIDEILHTFNSYDNKIQFTIETENNNSVPFLDTKLVRTEENIIKLDWYTKPTYSGRYINFNSYHTQKMKINLILALRNRIHKISHPSFLKTNLNKLFNILINNSYPRWFVTKFLYNTLITENLNVSHNHINSNIEDEARPPAIPNSLNNNNLQPLSPEISAFLPENQPVYYFSLPYIQDLTQSLEKILTKKTGIKIAGKHILKINNTFSRLKDVDENIKKSNVVYSLKCHDCDRNYVGQTSTVLRDRITRHKSDIRHQKNSCALAEHVLINDHNIVFLNVKVINTENNYNKRAFLEMVEIFLDENCLNKRRDIEDLSIIYS